MISVSPANAAHIKPVQPKIGYKKAWGYISRIISLCSTSLTASTKSERVLAIASPDFPDKVKYITTRMKLFSAVSLPFTCLEWKDARQKIFNSMHLNDREGLALNLMTFTVLSSEIVNSIATLFNAALETAGKLPIPVLSTIGMPLGYTINIISTTSRVIQVVKSSHLYNSLKNVESSQEKRKQLRLLLEEKFGLTLDETKLMLSAEEKKHLLEVKNADILRAAPQEVVDELRILYNMLKEDSSLNAKEISIKIDHVIALLDQKFKIDAMGIGANLLTFSALSMFTLGAVTATPFILLATSILIRISASAYQDFYHP